MPEYTRLGIYIPVDKQSFHPVERLEKLATEKDRSLSYVVVEAIEQFLEREESK